MKIKQKTDLLYLVTAMYLIFLLVAFFKDFDAKIEIIGKTYILDTKINLIEYWKITNIHLKGWKIYVLLFSMLIPSLIIDWVLINFCWVKCTKLYKLEKVAQIQKWEEYKNEKKQKDVR